MENIKRYATYLEFQSDIDNISAPCVARIDTCYGPVTVYIDDDGKTFYQNGNQVDESTVKNYDFLCFEAVGGSATVTLNKANNTKAIVYQYRIGEGNWNTLSISTGVTLSTGQKMYVRKKDGEPCLENTDPDMYYYYFRFTGKVEASGNCLSMCDWKTSKGCLKRLFYNATGLVRAPELPCTETAQMCYDCMFFGCTDLKYAPKELPASVVEDSAYYDMFYKCTSLLEAPVIRANEVKSAGCANMFSYCSSLVIAPELPAKKLGVSSYTGMFNKCTSMTSTPSTLPAETIGARCYEEMFSETYITKSPVICVQEYGNEAMWKMFYQCPKLNEITILLEESPRKYDFSSWVLAVASSGTFKKKSTSTWGTGYDGIPSGWTVENI